MLFFDRIKELTLTTGTGTLTLAGAVPGFVAFSTCYAAGATRVPYVVALGTEWEVGVGTLVNGTTLARTEIRASSSGGAAVNFDVGEKDVFSCVPGYWASSLITRGEASALTQGCAMP